MSLRSQVLAWLDAPRQQNFIIALILFNAVTLGLETSTSVMQAVGGLLHTLDRIVLAIFTLEVALRLWATGPRFFKNGWNVFDFVIVAISLMPATGALSVLRTLRILRLLRLVHKIPQLKAIVESVIQAIPGLGWVLAMLSLILYIFAVLGTKLFGAEFPELFGGLGATLFTLFQVMTLEGWAGDIARPVMDLHPWSVVYFLSFILVSTFTTLNLFIGIIVNSMQALTDQQMEEARAEKARQQLAEDASRPDLEAVVRLEELQGKLSGIVAEIQDLQAQIRTDVKVRSEKESGL